LKKFGFTIILRGQTPTAEQVKEAENAEANFFSSSFS